MGQYHLPVNLTKRQYLHPHRMGVGLKLLEQGVSVPGTTTGLFILLASSNNRGGGDLRSDREIIGSWAGDRIAVVGDYDDPHNLFEEAEITDEELRRAVAKMIDDDQYGPDPDVGSIISGMNIYGLSDTLFEDVSEAVLHAMLDDYYILRGYKELLDKGDYFVTELMPESVRQRIADAPNTL